MARLWQLLCVVLTLVATGCVARTNYYAATSRPTTATAYTLARRQTQIGLGVTGRTIDEFGANVELARGFGPGFEARANLFQLGLGAVNARLKYNFLDRPMFAMSAGVAGWWVRPSFLRLLSAQTRQRLEGTDIFAVPLGMTASVPLRYWGLLSLNATYHHSQVIGLVTDDNSVSYDGALAFRRFYLRPAVHVYVGNVVVLAAGAELPAYAETNLQSVITEPVAPGVEGGVRSNEFVTVPFHRALQAFASVETQFRVTHLRVYVTHGYVTRSLDAPVLPGIDVYWRF